jgi:hypothetical protein
MEKRVLLMWKRKKNMRVSVDRSDPFWDQVLTDDSDAYDLDGDAEVGLEYDDVGVDEGFG